MLFGLMDWLTKWTIYIMQFRQFLCALFYFVRKCAFKDMLNISGVTEFIGELCYEIFIGGVIKIE